MLREDLQLVQNLAESLAAKYATQAMDSVLEKVTILEARIAKLEKADSTPKQKKATAH